MHRRLGWAAAIFLLCVWMLGPVFEQVDPWDVFPDFGDNVLVMLMAVGACFAFALCLTLLAVATLRPAGSVVPSMHGILIPVARCFAPPSAAPHQLPPLRV